MDMIFVEGTTTQVIHNPIHQLTINLLLAKMNHSPLKQLKIKILQLLDKLTTVKRPLDPLGSLNPKSTLYWVSKQVMKEAVEDKKAELKQSGKEIPAKEVDILRLIDTSYLWIDQ